MARGNGIIVSSNPRGVFMEGQIATGETPKPGQFLQIQPATALVGGRHTFEIYNVAADGSRPSGPLYLLLPDELQGKVATDAYAAGDRCFLYTPCAGEEYNLLWANVAGTATISKGTVGIVDDTTGKVIATTGSPETEPCMLLEDIVDNAADQLAWSIWSGY